MVELDVISDFARGLGWKTWSTPKKGPLWQDHPDGGMYCHVTKTLDFNCHAHVTFRIDNGQAILQNFGERYIISEIALGDPDLFKKLVRKLAVLERREVCGDGRRC